MISFVMSAMISSNLLFTPLTINTQPKEISPYEIKQEIKPITKAVVDSYEYRQRLNIVATAYTGSADENGGYANITSSGKTLSRGMVASPSDIKFGTKFYIDDIGMVTVEDRGNPKHIRWIDKNTLRLDIFMESKSQAIKFGVRNLKGYMYKIQN